MAFARLQALRCNMLSLRFRAEGCRGFSIYGVGREGGGCFCRFCHGAAAFCIFDVPQDLRSRGKTTGTWR